MALMGVLGRRVKPVTPDHHAPDYRAEGVPRESLADLVSDNRGGTCRQGDETSWSIIYQKAL